ncbi:MAG TPA: hypothetical protein VNM92_11885 [Thermoanaerobaculia bacterium]|nr:hypothetical protein [Thermoanaerobaculia bacterium]
MSNLVIPRGVVTTHRDQFHVVLLYETVRQRRHLPSLLILFLLISCRREVQDDSLTDWLHVLKQKKAAPLASGPSAGRQAYAKSLHNFVVKHPTHGRGRHVYEDFQMQFARDLVSMGRGRDAVRFYRSVLQRNPANRQAREELTTTIDRLSVSTDKLESLTKGMTQREVAERLGKPLPGWTRSVVKRSKRAESWYYPREGRGVAGVHFYDGRLLTAELDSEERLPGLSGRVIK